MKQFKFLAMAFFAMVMSIGLVACSSDDDDNNGGNSTKKLVKIVSNGDGKENTYIFSYDTNGKLKSYDDGYDTYSFNWSDDKISITSINGESITCGLVNNLVRNSTKFNTRYTYNDNNKLSNVTTQYNAYSYKWDGDKIIKCENKIYSYSGKTCKGFNPVIFETDIFYGNDWFITCPELVGARSNQLPDGFKYKDDNNTEAKITYEFDSEGYVTEFTIQFYHDGEPSTNEWDTWKYELTWK